MVVNQGSLMGIVIGEMDGRGQGQKRISNLIRWGDCMEGENGLIKGGISGSYD